MHQTRYVRGNGLHVDPGMLLVWIELEPVRTEDDLAFEPGLKPLHSFNCTSGGFLDLCQSPLRRDISS